MGINSAKRIIKARKNYTLTFDDLKKLGVVMKRAKYFITVNNKYFVSSELFKKSFIESNLVTNNTYIDNNNFKQLSLFNE